jgi:hypothetical protein
MLKIHHIDEEDLDLGSSSSDSDSSDYSGWINVEEQQKLEPTKRRSFISCRESASHSSSWNYANTNYARSLG